MILMQEKKRVPVKPLRVRESKKDRLRRRWAGRDRFGIAKAMGQEIPRLRNALKRRYAVKYFILGPYSKEVHT